MSRELLAGSDTAVCSVVGFPHGDSHPELIIAEAERAMAEGARDRGRPAQGARTRRHADRSHRDGGDPPCGDRSWTAGTPTGGHDGDRCPGGGSCHRLLNPRPIPFNS
jgi:hypothetical protein